MTLLQDRDELRQKREEFIREWQLTEKASERIAGIILIFAGALVIVFDKPADQFTILAIALAISGGFTMIFRSRRPTDMRKPLAYIRSEVFGNRALMASLGAILGVWQGIVQDRFLFLLVGGLLVLVTIWYRWRERRVQHFDSLFPKKLLAIEEETSNE